MHNLRIVLILIVMLFAAPVRAADDTAYVVSFALQIGDRIDISNRLECRSGRWCQVDMMNNEIIVYFAPDTETLRLFYEDHCCFFSSGTNTTLLPRGTIQCVNLYEGDRTRRLEFNLNKKIGFICLTMSKEPPNGLLPADKRDL